MQNSKAVFIRLHKVYKFNFLVIGIKPWVHWLTQNGYRRTVSLFFSLLYAQIKFLYLSTPDEIENNTLYDPVLMTATPAISLASIICQMLCQHLFTGLQ